VLYWLETYITRDPGLEINRKLLKMLSCKNNRSILTICLNNENRKFI